MVHKLNFSCGVFIGVWCKTSFCYRSDPLKWLALTPQSGNQSSMYSAPQLLSEMSNRLRLQHSVAILLKAPSFFLLYVLKYVVLENVWWGEIWVRLGHMSLCYTRTYMQSEIPRTEIWAIAHVCCSCAHFVVSTVRHSCIQIQDFILYVRHDTCSKFF